MTASTIACKIIVGKRPINLALLRHDRCEVSELVEEM